MLNSRNIFPWIPAGTWMGIIFYLSSRTGYGGSEWMSIVAHIVEYAVLTGLFWFALTRSTGMGAASIALIAIALSTVYGISDEWHQSLVPGRLPDVFDVFVDFSAATGASLIAYFRK